jgi:hypothetical protein
MDSTSNKIIFIILFFGCCWILLDLSYGEKTLAGIAAALDNAITGG